MSPCELFPHGNARRLQHAVGQKGFDELAGDRAGGFAAGAGVFQHDGESDPRLVGRERSRQTRRDRPGRALTWAVPVLPAIAIFCERTVL